MEVHIDKRTATISIGGEMTIYAAAQLQGELFPYLEAAKNAVTMNLSGVTALDTAGLQLLFMFRRIGLQNGVPCRFVKPSAIVVEVLDLCGLRESLLGHAAKEAA